MSRGMGALQRNIHWALCCAPDEGMPLRDLMREAGATDLPNFRRSLKSMERAGKVDTRLERGEDGVVRRIVRSLFWPEVRRAIRQDIEEDPDPVYCYPDDDHPDEEEEEEEEGEEELDPAELLAEMAEEEARWEREREAAASEPEPDYGWLDELDLEELRDQVAEAHLGGGDTRAPSEIRGAAK